MARRGAKFDLERLSLQLEIYGTRNSSNLKHLNFTRSNPRGVQIPPRPAPAPFGNRGLLATSGFEPSLRMRPHRDPSNPCARLSASERSPTPPRHAYARGGVSRKRDAHWTTSVVVSRSRVPCVEGRMIGPKVQPVPFGFK